MKGIERGDNLEPTVVVTELAGEFEETFVGLGAAVAEKTFAGADESDQGLREPALWLVIIEIGGVDELARLLDQRLGDGRVAVAQRTDRNASAHIQIPFAGEIVQVASRAVTENDVKAAIARHNVLLEQGLYGRHVVADDGRRRGSNFFHR